MTGRPRFLVQPSSQLCGDYDRCDHTDDDPLLWPALDDFLGGVSRRGLSVGLDTTGHGLEPARAARLAPVLASVGIPTSPSRAAVRW